MDVPHLLVIGEARMLLTHGGRELLFAGLVVENLDVDILAGMPFMHRNEVGVFPARHEVLFGDGTVHRYMHKSPSEPVYSTRRALVLRAPPQSLTVWPGDFVEVSLPSDCSMDTT